MILKSISLGILAIVLLTGGTSAYNPATQQPATQQPATQQPATQQPATQQPATQQPATQQPAKQQPATPPTTSPPATSPPLGTTNHLGTPTSPKNPNSLVNPDHDNNAAPAGNTNALISPDKYPTVKIDNSANDTYGKSTVIKDPYRLLEDPDGEETKKFVEEEMAITKAYLENYQFRKELAARYKDLMNYPSYVGPIQIGKKIFSYQNTGLQNQDVIYVHDAAGGEDIEFFDPNQLSKDGSVLLDESAFTDDGLIFAYITVTDGSDWQTLQFKHVEKGNIYKDKLTKLKYSYVSWTKDNKGVFYSGFPDYKGKTDGSDKTPTKNHKLLYHVLGTEQSADVIVAEFLDQPDYYVSGIVSDDGRYLIVTAVEGTSNTLIYVADLDKIKYEIKGKLDLIPLVTKLEADYYYVTNVETIFIFQTDKDADNHKLVSIDITNPSSWKDLVPEDKNNNMEWAQAAWDKYLIINYTVDVKSCLQLHDIKTGKLVKKFDLEIGTVKQCISDKKYKDIYFTLESFFTPGTTYHCDLSQTSFDLDVFQEIKVKNFDKTKFTAVQLFYKSKDGTRIPMYCTYKNGLEKNGNNFAFLYAFGGFSESMLPYFAENRIVVIDNFNGVHCVLNVRGGGEYGEIWHRGGSLDKKQNCIDDFLAGAEFLVKEQYTNSNLIAINGGTNGGLLMTASLNQRPDLFGAVVADSPITDMLRFDQFTCGRAWVSEYGTATNAKDFEFLIKYSPLHNINLTNSPNKQYPATMITVEDHDDRVSPLHSLKFVATMQADAKKNPNQKNPLLLRVEFVGNDADTQDPIDKAIAELVDMISFIALNTGIKYNGS